MRQQNQYQFDVRIETPQGDIKGIRFTIDPIVMEYNDQIDAYISDQVKKLLRGIQQPRIISKVST